LATLETPVTAGITSCHGYEAFAEDGSAGVVETPLFPPDSDTPDFLVIRVRLRGRLFPRFPVVPVSLVSVVDHSVRTVRLAATRADIERLPEQLPVAL
jgi:hypothetical protein